MLVAALSGCTGTAQPPQSDPPAPVASPSMWTPAATEAPPELSASPAASPGSTPENPFPSLSPIAQPTPEGGPWTAVDVTATTAAQITSATALPESLRTFLASRIGIEDDFGCTTSEVVIKAVHPDGYAFGSEDSDCGGGQVVWGITENQWNYIVQFGDAMPCGDFESNSIPKGVPGLRCVDDSGKATDY